MDEQIVLSSILVATDLANCAGVVQEADFGHPVVRRGHPLVVSILMSEQAKRLVGPRQLKTAFVP